MIVVVGLRRYYGVHGTRNGPLFYKIYAPLSRVSSLTGYGMIYRTTSCLLDECAEGYPGLILIDQSIL
jgi:hypothetical protein